MTKYMDYPTVEFRKLVDSNFKDQRFKAYVERWFAQNMTAIPMGLLDTESDIAFERWDIQPDAIHSVEELVWTTFQCPECESEHASREEDCCTQEVEQPDGSTKDVPVELEQTSRTVYVIYNESTGEYVSTQRYVRHAGLNPEYDDVPMKEEEVCGWEDRADAEGDAEAADRAYQSEHGNENRYGFPWANSWGYLPDNYIQDDSLRKAGFTVASYTGGSGNSRSDASFRIVGIDGGGYDFVSSHWARLVCHHHESRDIWVETDNGPAYITTDYRSDLQKIAEAVNNAEEGL